jgi:glycosyltransferase involved in cell wall biosynthesis
MHYDHLLDINILYDEKVLPEFSNICIITTVHQPFDTRIFHREADSLLKHKAKVTLIAPCEGKPKLINKVSIIGVSLSTSRIGRWLGGCRVLLIAMRLKADIYHFHDPELIPCGLLLQLLTRKPVIYDVHEHYPDAIKLKDWLPRSARNFLATLFDRVEIWAASLFDAIISADDEIASRFKQVHNRLVTLYNFPKADFGQMQGGIKPQRQHDVQLLYVGCNSWDRGQWLMLDVVRILVSEKKLDVGLWVIGKFDSEGKHREFIETVDSDELLRNRVVCPGIIPLEQLGPWLASADVGLVPLQPVDKFYKNIPTKMFEYMAVGLPIVGSDLPPIRRFIQESNAGLLAIPSDPHSHAEKILSIIECPEMAKQMGQKGREAFLSKFNWTSEEKKLLSLYRELLKLPQDRDVSP